VLVDFFERDATITGKRADAHDIARELPDHVTAWNPRRQHETLALGIGPLDAARHMEQVSGG
jgi:hypothetical protein